MSTLIANLGSGLTLHREELPSPAVLNLLSQTHWGGRGSRYQLMNFKVKLANLGKPFFLFLQAGDRLLGAYCLVRRQVNWEGLKVPAIYRTGFVVAPQYRGQGYGKLLAQAASNYLRSGKVEADFSYGFVDPQNQNSVASLSALQYQPVARFFPLIFFRHRPKRRCNSRVLSALEREKWREGFGRQYGHFDLFDESAIGSFSKVYVSDHPDNPSLAMQEVKVRLGGLENYWARILFQILQLLPGMRKYFSGGILRLLTFEALCHASISSTSLADLMETILAENRASLALIFLDPRDPNYTLLKTEGRLGWIDRCYRVSPVQIWVDSLSSSDNLVFRSGTESPVYIAAGDVL